MTDCEKVCRQSEKLLANSKQAKNLCGKFLSNVSNWKFKKERKKFKIQIKNEKYKNKVKIKIIEFWIHFIFYILYVIAKTQKV